MAGLGGISLDFSSPTNAYSSAQTNFVAPQKASVLGAQTQAIAPTKSPTTTPQLPPSNSPVSQSPTFSVGNNNPHVNPATGQWDDNYFQSQGGGGGGGNNLPNINDLYQPQMDFLSQMGDSLAATQKQQQGGIDTQYSGRQKGIADQIAQLKQQNITNRTGYDQQVQSAVAQAAKDYDAVRQRNLSMFGGQSSAGSAADELLGNTYLQTRQGLSNAQLQGDQGFDNEDLGVNTWGSTQNNQLDSWKAQANDQINSIFQQGMNQINQDKAATEEDKTSAKLSLLQQVVNHRQAIEDYHQQLLGQMQLAQAAMPNGNYNTAPFAQQIQGLAGSLPGMSQNLQQMAHMGGVPQQQAQSFNFQYGMPGAQGNQNREDLLLNQTGIPGITG